MVRVASICPHCEHGGCWPVSLPECEKVIIGTWTSCGGNLATNFGNMWGSPRLMECPKCKASWNEDIEGQLIIADWILDGNTWVEKR